MQGEFLEVEDAMQAGDETAAVDLDHVDDRNFALSSDDDEAIARRLRPKRANADVSIHQPLWQTTQRAPAKRKKQRGFLDGRRRGPCVANRSVSKVALVDPVEDELLLDCVLAIRPHAQRESSQRVNGWQAVVAELKRLSATRLGRYLGPGLRMRVAFLLRALQDPLHPKHVDVRGGLRTKLTEYQDSLLAQQAPCQRRITHATAQDTVTHQGDEHSDSDDFELFNTSARRASRRHAPPPQAESTPCPQPFPRRDVHTSRGTLQQQQHASDGTGTAATAPAQEAVVPPSSSAMLADLMQQAAAARREHYDMAVLLASQADAVLEQNQRFLEQDQARMDDQREWRTRCLSLLLHQPPPRAAGNDELYDSEC